MRKHLPLAFATLAVCATMAACSFWIVYWLKWVDQDVNTVSVTLERTAR